MCVNYSHGGVGKPVHYSHARVGECGVIIRMEGWVNVYSLFTWRGG